MGVSQEFISLTETMHGSVKHEILPMSEYDTISFYWNGVCMFYHDKHGIDFLLDLANVTLTYLAARMNISKDMLIVNLVSLHRKKNAGYAGLSDDPWFNFRAASQFGVTPYQGCLVRLSDKYQRYANLYHDASLEQVNEKIEDTLFDLAAYCLIAVCLYREIPQAGKQFFDATFDNES